MSVNTLRYESDEEQALHNPERWTPRGRDIEHDVMTCDKPICRETAAMIRARGARQVQPT